MFKGEALECVTIAALAPLGIPTVVAIVVRTCSVQLHLSIVGTCSSACINSTSVAFHTGPFFSLHFFTVYQGLTVLLDVLLDVLLVLMVTLTMAHPCSPPRNNINVTNNDGGVVEGCCWVYRAYLCRFRPLYTRYDLRDSRVLRTV